MQVGSVGVRESSSRRNLSTHTQQIRLFPNDSKSTQRPPNPSCAHAFFVCAPPQKSLFFFFNKMQQRSFFHSSFVFRGFATMIRRSSPPSVSSSQRLVLQSSSSRSLCVLKFYYCFFCVINSTVLSPLKCQTKQIKKKRCVKFRVSNEDTPFFFSVFCFRLFWDEDDTRHSREREREREGRQEAKALCGQRREGRKEGASRRGKGTLFSSSSSSPGSSSSSEEEESTRIYISLVVLECD